MKDGDKKAPLLVAILGIVISVTAAISALLGRSAVNLLPSRLGLGVLRHFAGPAGALLILKFGWLRILGGLPGIYRALGSGKPPELKLTIKNRGKNFKRVVAISDTHNQHRRLTMP